MLKSRSFNSASTTTKRSMRRARARMSNEKCNKSEKRFRISSINSKLIALSSHQERWKRRADTGRRRAGASVRARARREPSKATTTPSQSQRRENSTRARAFYVRCVYWFTHVGFDQRQSEATERLTTNTHIYIHNKTKLKPLSVMIIYNILFCNPFKFKIQSVAIMFSEAAWRVSWLLDF